MTQGERRWQPVLLGGDVPPPAGAYSPAVRAGGFVFVSGQIPRDPVSGGLVGGDIESQTRQEVSEVRPALEGAGAPLADVAWMVGDLAAIDGLGRFNSSYKEVVPQPVP